MNKSIQPPPIAAEPVVRLMAGALSSATVEVVEDARKDRPASEPAPILQIITRKLAVSHGDPVRPFVDLLLAQIHLRSGDAATAAVLAHEAASDARRLHGDDLVEVLAGAASVLESVEVGAGRVVLRQALGHVLGSPTPVGLGEWLCASAQSRDQEESEEAFAAVGALPLDERARVLARVSFAPGPFKARLLLEARALLQGLALGLHGLSSASTALRALTEGAVAREDAELVLETLRADPRVVTWGLPEPVHQVLCALGHAASTVLLDLGHQVSREAGFGFRSAAVALLGRLEDGEAGRRTLESLLDDIAIYRSRANPLSRCARDLTPTELDFLHLVEEVIILVPVLELGDQAVLRLRQCFQDAHAATGFARASLLAACVRAAGLLDESASTIGVLEAEILGRHGIELDDWTARDVVRTLGRTHDPWVLHHVHGFAREAASRVRNNQGGERESTFVVIEAWRAVRLLGEDGAGELELVLELLPRLHEHDRLEAMERLVWAGETLDAAGPDRLLERLPLPLADCCVRCAIEEDTTRPFRWLLHAIEEVIERGPK